LKVPEFRLFTREEFPDQPWIEKLLRPLNATLGQTIAGLRNGLTFGENLNAEVKQLDVTTHDEWRVLALENSWVNSPDVSPLTAAYRKDGAGNVHFRGEITGGAFSTTLRIGRVAAGYAPEHATSRMVEGHNAGGVHSPAFLEISPDGDMFPHAGPASADITINELAYPAGAPIPNGCFPVKFKTKVRGKVAGLLLLRCVELDQRNEKIAPGIGSPAWEQDGESVILRDVPGLAGSKMYRLTLAVVGG
jgi:hypothetical protein